MQMADDSELKVAVHHCNKTMKAACAVILSLKRQQDAERTEHRRYNSKARDEVMRLRQQVEDTSQQLKLALQKQAELCEELAGRDTEIDQLRSAAESAVKRRLQEVEATYNLEIRRLRSQVADQEAALKFHEDKNTELQLTVTACSSENDLLSKNMAYMRQRFDELLDIGDALSAKNSSLSDQLQRTSEMLEERDERIRKLERLADEYRYLRSQNCSSGGASNVASDE